MKRRTETKKKWNYYTALETYEKWWLGKLVYLNGEDPSTAKRVTKIEVRGPFSFVYGDADIFFEDGTYIILPNLPEPYRPRKQDLIVISE